MRKMQFDYEVYYWDNGLFPIIILLFAVLVIIIVIHSLRKDGIPKNGLLKLLLFFIIVTLCISVNIIPLARGGIFLIFEKEDDAVYITGKIEDVFELSFFGSMKYNVEQNHGYGEGLMVNGMKYYLMTYGDYKEGDMVTIKVLPKSKLVLELAPAELAE